VLDKVAVYRYCDRVKATLCERREQSLGGRASPALLLQEGHSLQIDFAWIARISEQ
jgi:hypothetical protein